MQPEVQTSPKLSDEVRKTSCYMCACRCGINVHLKQGRVAYIEGNRDHPVNRGVLCGKGSAGIMQHLSPARLRAPLRRIGARGEGHFEEISWDEALALATAWMAPLRATAPEKLAFFTGRDQSQSFTGWWAQAFGTPNYAAHGGFCSVNMAAAGIYTLGGAFWEFGQPDWDRAKLFLLFGVAEDHDSNPIKIGIGKLKSRGARIVAINPIRSGYGAVADDWFGITPGTDGLLVLSLIHELLAAGRIDLDYLASFTNAPLLVDEDPGLGQSRPVPARRRRPAADDRPRHRRKGALRPAGRKARPRRPLDRGRHHPSLGVPESSPNATSPTTTPPKPSPPPPASRRPASARWRPRSPGWPSTRPSPSTGPGPTGAAIAMPPCRAGRWRCTPCAASRRIPTASRPPAPSICCKS